MKRGLLCPSTDPSQEGSVAFAVVAGTAEHPDVIPLPQLEPVTPELLASSAPVTPREVYRFAGTCIEGECLHWTGAACSLAQRIIKGFEPAVTRLPPCRIRASCRWWHQEGRAACFRCPQIPTDIGSGDSDETSTVEFL